MSTSCPPFLAESFTREDIRTIVKFHVLLNKSAADIHALLAAALGNNASSVQTVRHWHRHFQEGHESTSDAHRSGRPATKSTDEMVACVRDAVEEDRRQTCEQLAECLNMARSTVSRILHENLAMKKIAAK